MPIEDRLLALESTMTLLFGYLAQRFPDGEALGDISELHRLVDARNIVYSVGDSEVNE